MHTIRQVISSFETARPFREHEAWLLFRIAAFAEAAGWTMLILGIGVKRYLLHGNDIPVLIAGQFHGTLFILYAAASIGLYPSLGWGRLRGICAALASVPPYGSLLFELYANHRRASKQATTPRHSFQRAIYHSLVTIS